MSDVRVSVDLKRFTLEYSGSLPFFERVIDPLLARVAPYPGRRPAPAAPEPIPPAAPSEAPAPATPVVPRGYRPTSPEFGAFVQKLGPEAGEPDRQIVAFAFYLWNYEKRDVVSEEEVAGCFRALGLKPPESAETLYQDLSQRLRFLQAGREPGTWTLTTKGANYVKTRLLGTL